MNRSFKGVWIPKEIWLSDELTLQEKVFLTEIDSLDNEKGCFASNSYFAKFFNLSKGRCSQVISSLENKKRISIKYIYGEDKSIEKRIIKVVNKLNTPIKLPKEGCLGSDEENNTLSSNTKDIKDIVEIVNYLNESSGKKFKSNSKVTQKHINARIKEGYTLESFKKVIDTKTQEWLHDKKMNKYLRPETLFGNKMESYLNEDAQPTSEYDDLF